MRSLRRHGGRAHSLLGHTLFDEPFNGTACADWCVGGNAQPPLSGDPDAAIVARCERLRAGWRATKPADEPTRFCSGCAFCAPYIDEPQEVQPPATSTTPPPPSLTTMPSPTPPLPQSSPPTPPPPPPSSRPPPPPPPSSSPPPPHTLHFDFAAEATPPGWRNEDDHAGGTYAWTRTSGASAVSPTGPRAGVGGAGYYFYTEASAPREPGDTFSLSYDGGAACAGGGDVGGGGGAGRGTRDQKMDAVRARGRRGAPGNISAISFHYSMRGSGMGTLEVVDARGVTKFSRSGDQHHQHRQSQRQQPGEPDADWLASGAVAVDTPSFAFRATRGATFESHVAVAHVDVVCA